MPKMTLDEADALLDSYYKDTTPAAPPAPSHAGFISDVKRGFGQQVGSLAREGRDLGIPLAEPVEKWGMDLAAKNPSSINSISDILAHPVVTAREAVGEMSPQIIATLGAAGTGAAAGGAVAGPLGAVVGGVGGALAYTYGQERGGIRQRQDEKGVDDPGRASLAALPATALELVFGPEASAALRSIRGAGGQIAEKAGEGIIKRAAKQAAGEGVTEVGQSALERMGAGDSLTDQDALNDYAISGIKGAVGGAAFSPMDGGHNKAKPGQQAAPAAEAPVADNEPTDLLRLTDQRGDAPIVVPPGGAGWKPGETPTSRASPVEALPIPAGHQGDLFHAGADTPIEQDLLAPKASAEEAGGVDPASKLATVFTKDNILGHLRAANEETTGKPTATGPALKLANNLARSLMNGDVEAAAQHVVDAGNNSKVPAHLAQAAEDIVRHYGDMFMQEHGVTVQKAEQAGPTPLEAAIPPAPEPTAAPVNLSAVPQPAADNTSAVGQMRASILQGIIADPTTNNPTRRFTAELRKRGMENVGLEPHEAETIARFEDAKAAFASQQEPVAAPGLTMEAPAQVDPNEDTTLGVPERKPALTMASTPAPTQTIGDKLKARAKQRDFALMPYSEQDLARKQRAAERRDARQAPVQAPASARADQSAMFDDSGAPTPVALKETREQVLAAADSMLARLKAPKARKMFEAQVNALHDGKTSIDFVRHYYTLLTKSQFGKAQKLAEIENEKAQPIPEKPAARAERKEGPAREEAKPLPEKVEARAQKLGPTKGKHFRAGARVELGLSKEEAPAGSTMAAAFEEGRQAARTPEPETQTKPADETPASEALVQGFRQMVDDMRGKADGLTSVEASRLDELAHEGVPLAQLDQALTRALADSKAQRQAAAERFKAGIKAPKVQAQRATRREFMAGAAAGAVAAGLPRTAISAPSLQAAIQSGKLQDAVQYVATTSRNPMMRAIAEKLVRGGLGDVKVHIIDVTKSDNDAQYNGMDEDTRGMVTSAHGLTSAPQDGSSPTVYLMTGKDKATEFQGLTEETLIHEAIHAYVMQRYAGISVYLPRNRELLKAPAKSGDGAVDAWTKLWRPISDKLSPGGVVQDDLPVHIAEFVRSPDEALSWALTNADTQAWLKSIDIDGKPLPNKGAPSAWTRFINWVGSLFGMKPADNTAFGKLLDAGYSVLDHGALDRPDGSFSRAIAKFQDAKSQQVSPRLVDKTIEKLPAALQEPTHIITDNITEALQKGLTMTSFTRHLIEDAAKVLPAANDYARATREQAQITYSHQAKVEKIATAFLSLKPAEQEAANLLLDESTRSNLWAYDPKAGTAQAGTAKVDPALAARFKALSPEAQAAIKAMHAHSAATLAELKPLFMKNLDTDFDAQIADAVKAGDNDSVKRLRKEKAERLGNYESMIGIREGTPYNPLKRFGNYVVIARSAEYQRQNKLAKEGDADAVKWIKDHQDDESHNLVDYRETMGEAKALAAQLAKHFPDGRVVPMERAKADASVSNGNLFLAFDQLRHMISDLTGSDAKASRDLRTMVTDLYLRSLSDASARKSHLARKGVAMSEASRKGNAIRAFISQGQADARLIAHLTNHQEVLQSLSDIRNQARDDDHPETQAARMRFANEIAMRHAADSATQSSPISEAIKGFTGAMMLTTSPAYVMQNLTQVQLLAVPILAKDHGYMRTQGAVMKAQGDVAKVIAKAPLAGDLDLTHFSDKDDQAAVNDWVKRGAIDITVASDLGSLGQGNQLWAKTHRFLTNIVNKAEMNNRLVTLLAGYRMARERGMDHQAAVDYADKVNADTNFDYSGHNTPRLMRGPVAGVLTQFKKFQLGQISLMARLASTAMDGMSDPAERAAAVRGLAFITTHAGIVGGALGLPGAQLIGFFLGHLLGDDDEPKDIEYQLRKLLPPEIANLVLKGVPTMAGLDLSGKLGMGTMLSPLPFTDIDLKSTSGYNAMATALLGPALGGLGPRYADGLGLALGGDYYKASEKFLPSGLANAARAYRESTQGVTNRAGDDLIAPGDVNLPLLKALGLTTTQDSERYFLQDMAFKQNEILKGRANQIKHAYQEAHSAGDAAAMSDARQDWRDLQHKKRELGLKPTPITSLTRQPKGAGAIDGVHYNKSTKRFVKQLSTLVDDGDAQ